jgi:hypothetical protein
MKNEYFNPKITVFKTLFNSNDTPHYIEVDKIVNRIRTGTEKTFQLIEKIRSGEPNKDELKKQLAAIMFNGIFKTRNDAGIEEHTGLCILDFDKFETLEILNDHRIRLAQDRFTYMVFLSPSGNGLKVVIKIPKSSKDEHFRRFHAYKKYIDSIYFDDKNSNLSRVCFDSFDPNIYFNPESELFEQIKDEEEKTYIHNVPVVILKDQAKIIDRLITIISKNNSFVTGERNNFVFNLACMMCEYEIDQTIAESEIASRYMNSDFGHNEIILTIRSAYRKAERNPKKFFEDNDLKKVIKQKIKTGDDSKSISNQVNVTLETVEEVKKEVDNTESDFWEIKKTKNGIFITIISNAYNYFLKINGFNKFYPEKSETPVFVRVIENKVKVISTEIIKDFVLNWLKSKNHISVWNFLAESPRFFSDNYLNYLSPIDLKMIKDTNDTSYIPYNNGILKVTRDQKELINYIDIDAYIWENQIIPRDWSEVENYSNDFQDFVSKVTNEDASRTISLESTIGYLLHGYKDKTHQKAIIFNDQEIDDTPNGGSGKSLLVTALSLFRSVVKIDGKHFNPLKSDFVYQRVNLDTQILAFDDVKRNFDFEYLFPLITEGITVNRKNKDEIFIPFDSSPKIVITTNYVIAGAGESHDRRRHEIEFFQYFNKKNSPLKVYGKLLFDQWDEKDWINFDNYMVANIQSYLINGLVQPISINVDTKRFISSTCKEFYDFMNEGFIEINKAIYNSDAINMFFKENRSLKDLDTRKFMKWIGEFANYKGLKLKKGRDSKGRYFTISNIAEKEDQLNLPI